MKIVKPFFAVIDGEEVRIRNPEDVPKDKAQEWAASGLIELPKSTFKKEKDVNL
jgi:hypothetical protein